MDTKYNEGAYSKLSQEEVCWQDSLRKTSQRKFWTYCKKLLPEQHWVIKCVLVLYEITRMQSGNTSITKNLNKKNKIISRSAKPNLQKPSSSLFFLVCTTVCKKQGICDFGNRIPSNSTYSQVLTLTNIMQCGDIMIGPQITILIRQRILTCVLSRSTCNPARTNIT